MSGVIGPCPPWRAQNTDPDNPVTISIASPAVITWTSGAHGLVQGNVIRFSTTGALPGGITPFEDGPPPGGGGILSKKEYYVMATGLTATQFQISAVAPVKGVDGSAVNTSGVQSGSHYAQAAYSAQQLASDTLVGQTQQAQEGAA